MRSLYTIKRNMFFIEGQARPMKTTVVQRVSWRGQKFTHKREFWHIFLSDQQVPLPNGCMWSREEKPGLDSSSPSLHLTLAKFLWKGPRLLALGCPFSWHPILLQRKLVSPSLHFPFVHCSLPPPPSPNSFISPLKSYIWVYSKLLS